MPTDPSLRRRLQKGTLRSSLYLLEVTDPVESPGCYVHSEAVWVLGCEDSQRGLLRPIHPSLLQGHPVPRTCIDPEHGAGDREVGFQEQTLLPL